MPYGIIYVHVCDLSGKIYVGQTTTTLNRRKRGYGKQNRVIYNAIHKYGWNAFCSFSIALAENKEELDRLEQYWIAKLNTRIPYGYNIAAGGNGKGSCEGHPHSEESKAKIRAAHIGEKWTEERKAKFSITCTGRKRSEESKLKQSITSKGRKKPPRSKEHRLNMSIAKTGSKMPPISEETREKLSIARKLWWQEKKATEI